MAYRVTATTGLGSAISVILPSEEAVRAELVKYFEDGVSDVRVSDLDGKSIDIRCFTEEETPPGQRFPPAR